MDEFFQDVPWVVEAHGLEVQYLQERHKGSPWKYIAGTLLTVGQFHGHSVSLKCIKYEIDGKMIVFYEDTSVIVNHDLINDWLRAHTKARKTDAMNFHHTRT